MKLKKKATPTKTQINREEEELNNFIRWQFIRIY
jgi:hypothetical protein